jgi:hypothetical protein
MTITLGGVTLSDSMVWAERYGSFGVAQNVRRTLGGTIYLSSAKLVGGVPITLEATEEYGWLTRTQAQSILALAADPDGLYTLVFNGVSYSVAFRHNEPPAVALRPLIPRTADEAGDWLVGAIKLITL